MADEIEEEGEGKTAEEIAAEEAEAEAIRKAEEEAAGGETSDEKIARLEKEKADAEQKSKEQYEARKRAEKQRDEALGGLKPIDVLVLTKAGVDADDIEEIAKWAKFNGTSISDALKDETLKIILERRADERKTAQATNTRGSARGTAEVTGETLLQKAEETGEVPETTEGMNKLFLARQQRRLNSAPKRRT